MRLISINRLALSAVALVIAFSHPVSAEPLSQAVVDQIHALLVEKEARTAAQQKMDSQLVYALKRSLNQPIAPGITNLQFLPVLDTNGQLEVDVDATVTTNLLGFITQSGGTLISSVPQFDAIRARVPIALTQTLATRSDVRFVRLATKPQVETGSVTSEGDVTQTAALARQGFGADGSGVRIGVLSDSVDFLASSQATGDTPANLTVLQGQSGVPGSGEGTAMLEIVHDLAPGAELFFATANGGEANFAQNILALRAAGCDVIVDDIRYLTEPVFQDGVVARAVNSVTVNGALYFASAGNSGNKAHGTSGTWEGDFLDGGAAGAPVNGKNGLIHDFGGGVTYDTVTGFGGGVFLFWADPQAGSTNDYDLFVLDAAGTTLLGASTTVQNGSQNPIEGLIGNLAPGLRVVVVKAAGDVRFFHIDSLRGQLEINTTGFARGHSAATNAFATAAVDVATSYPNPFTGGAQNPVEDFSSDGPRRMFFQADGTAITPADFTATGGAVRQYPTIAASDGVQTAVPGFMPFFGTSAAAPHAAAIGGLLKSYNPDLSNGQIRALLTTTALDIEAPGVDVTSGYGILSAFQALLAAPRPIPLPRLLITTNLLFGGNGNGIIDFNECNSLTITLTNVGRADATGIKATLSTETPGAIVASPAIDYPPIAVGASAVNIVPFKLSTAPDFVCGTPIELSLLVKSDQTTSTNRFTLSSGQSAAVSRFDSTGPVTIPDASPAGTNSFVTVSAFTNAVIKATVSLYLNHTFDGDLTIQLISPDRTTNTLVAHNGGAGANYGLACVPENQRTTFDDAAPFAIGAANPPFAGSFQPQQPLSKYIGKSGTNVNGTWTLHVVDDAAFDVGTLQCWSLALSSVHCQDGGGECPGADLAVGMAAAPDPLVIGNPLTYTITVTNRGPSSAKNVIITHIFPNGAIFASAVPSQGSFSQNAGVLSCNFGTVSARGVATITVTVLPTLTGVALSSATATSGEADFDTSNNSVTVSTHVNPPTAELAVGISASPEPALLGGTLTYSISVTNNGPSPATSVVVSNSLPTNIVVISSSVSQGSLTSSNNVVVCSFNNLAVGAWATATINATPTAEGVLVATAKASSAQLDPLVGNNTASVSTTVGPAADLVITFINRPTPAVLGGNVTYLITITNRGPSPATSVFLTQTLPPGATLVSSNASQGTIIVTGGTLTWSNAGTLAVSAGAVISNVVTFGSSGTKLSTASAVSAQADPNALNNTANVTAQVSPPFVSLAASGATLTYEGAAPTNGAVDLGETVTVSLRLRNDGNVNNTNLTATLLATNGVITTNGQTQAYGVLAPGDVRGRPFTFTASGTNGNTVVATLQLHDVGGYNTNVSFTFTLPAVRAFSNSTAIAIRDQTTGLPYPSTISVSGVTGTVGKVTVTLVNASHTYPQDIDVLLVGPTGQKSILMSGAGAPPLANANITFDDAAASPIPDGGAQIVTASYQPAGYIPGLSLPPSAPAGPYPAGLGGFNAANPNGNWSLYVADHTAGDTGSIAGGWSMAVTLISPVNQLADVGILAAADPAPAVVGQNLTYSFTVTNRGPANATFVTFTNPLPTGVSFVSVGSSQGSIVSSPGGVAGTLGPLVAGAAATVTVVVSPTPSVVSPLVSTATVSSTNELDLNLVNNTVSTFTPTVFPNADVSVVVTSSPSPTVLGFTLTNSIFVTNNGPGTAFGVWLTNSLPPGTVLVPAGSTPGGTSIPGSLVFALGNLAANSGTNLAVVLSPTNLVSISNSVYAATSSNDTNILNNLAAGVVPVSNAVPVIVAAGSVLLDEGGPKNGGLDNGETVTLSLSLRNDGYADTTNFTATLLSGNGVSSPSGPKTYGTMVRGGPSQANTFSFIAGGTNGAPVQVVLSLTNSSGSLGTVTFTYFLAGDHTFGSGATNVIPDHGTAAIYPSTINVTGQTGIVVKATVTLSNLSHSFPRDVNVLLVSPAGGKVLLMSHAGGAHALTNVTLTFDDNSTNTLPQNDAITAGTRQPTAFAPAVAFPAPAPAGPSSPLLAGVNGGDPNGDWSLFVFDDSAGDGGVLRGWSLKLTTVLAINALSDLALGMSSAPGSMFVGGVITNTITVTNLGPAAVTDVYVTNVFPVDVTLVSPNAGLINLGPGGVTLTLSMGNLGIGGTAGSTVVVAPTKGGAFVSTARAAGLQTDVNLFNNTAQTTTTVIVPAPAVLSGSISNGAFHLNITVQSNFNYVIQASTNLAAATWVSLSTNTPSPGGVIKYVDTNAPSYFNRYYRAVRLIP